MPTIIARSLLGRCAAIALAVVAAVFYIRIVLSDGLHGALPALGWGGLVGMAVWSLWWAPMMTIAEDSIRVRNVLRSFEVSWDALVGSESTWNLILLLSGGRRVPVVACQRPGGLRQSAAHAMELRQTARFGKAGSNPQAVSAALEHRHVREEFLDPSQRTFRAGLNAAAAADLLEAYQERREAHLRLQARQRRREERLGKNTSEGSEGAEASAAPRDSLTSRLNRIPIALTAVFAVISAASLILP